MVKIRLRRVGSKKKPSYRLVVADSRAPRDGAFIDILGHYNPLTDPETVVIDEDKARHWLEKGAQPTDTAARLLAKAGIIEEPEARKEKIKADIETKPKTSKKKAKAGVTEEPEASKEEPEASTIEEPKARKKKAKAGVTEEPEASTTEEPEASKKKTKTSKEKT
ncbi:hypothetical protein ES703_85526 [subsurface metagenome]